jgi:hypothetical protein
VLSCYSLLLFDLEEVGDLLMGDLTKFIFTVGFYKLFMVLSDDIYIGGNTLSLILFFL